MDSYGFKLNPVDSSGISGYAPVLGRISCS